MDALYIFEKREFRSFKKCILKGSNSCDNRPKFDSFAVGGNFAVRFLCYFHSKTNKIN